MYSAIKWKGSPCW